ncbi:MAG: TRAP-type mannitol/chloroaromatic compound transport system permease small subunit [Planctomycetota bacterium]|jgi:TRAP-type mannitol/chloroaromatic compound transport system permease small subunit
MPPLLRLAARIDRLTRAVGQMAAWLALAMVLVGAYNAIARYVGRHFELRLTSNALVEAQWYMFSLLFLFGAPWALQNGDHVRVDVLYGRLGKRGRARINLAGSLLLLLPFCVFAITTIAPSAWASFELREVSNDPGGLLRWPLKLAMPLAFGLLFAQGVSEAIKSFYTLRGVELPALANEEEQA